MSNADPEQINQLINQLTSGNSVAERRNAAMELGTIQSEQSIKALVEALSDHEDVAIFATLALTKIGKPAVPILCQALHSPNEQIRGYAAEILGEINAEECLEDLVELIKRDESNWVRNSAVEAIGRFKNPETIDFLKQLLTSDNNWMLVSASLALHRMGIRDNLANILIDRLFTKNDLERGITAWALVEICDKSHIDTLQRIAQQNQDPVVESVIDEIIRGISLK